MPTVCRTPLCRFPWQDIYVYSVLKYKTLYFLLFASDLCTDCWFIHSHISMKYH